MLKCLPNENPTSNLHDSETSNLGLNAGVSLRFMAEHSTVPDPAALGASASGAATDLVSSFLDAGGAFN